MSEWRARSPVNGLAAIGRLALEELLKILNAREAQARRRAVETLGELGHHGVDGLVVALADMDENVRNAATLALSH